MTDESDCLARLCIDFEGNRFQIKVFEFLVGIERQPGGENVLLDKALHPDAAALYDPETEVWNYGALFRLLKQYPFYTLN